MPRTIVIGVSGVGQRLAPVRSDGIRAIVQEINALALPDVRANYYRWTQDPGELAANIRAKASSDLNTRIIFACHSRGAETACQTIEHYDAPVYAVCFADGWNGLRECSTLTVPMAVQKVFSWRQPLGMIHGSKIELADPSWTQWPVDALVGGVGHAAMDEYEKFKETVMQLARGEL